MNETNVREQVLFKRLQEEIQRSIALEEAFVVKQKELDLYKEVTDSDDIQESQYD